VIASAPLGLVCDPPTGPVKVNAAYSSTCIVTGGIGPYAWSLGGGLPAGLGHSAEQGASYTISGTPMPAAVGPYSYTVTVTDATSPAHLSKSKEFTGSVSSGDLILTCTPKNGPALVGDAYKATCSVSGGTAPYTWSLTGNVPAGIAPGALTGGVINITGAPTTPGSYTYSVHVSDSSVPQQQSAAQDYTGVVAPQPLTLQCTPTTGPAILGVFYSATCTASGGIQPYLWTIESGGLPTGLSLSATAGPAITISGIPTAPGDYSYTVRVTDSSSAPVAQVAQTATRIYTGTVVGPLITTTSLPAATVGTQYTFTIEVEGGASPFAWSVVTGTLPAGLTLDPVTGVVSGTPTAPGTSTFTIQIVDGQTGVSSAPFTLTVGLPPAPAIDFSGLPDTVTAAQQVSWLPRIATAYPLALTMQMTLSFVPDSGLPDDPAIQFASGGRTVTVTIPAGSTQGPAAIAFQTGTVAGNIVITVRLSTGGQDITPPTAPSHGSRLNPLAPVIRTVTLARAADGFDVIITGYSVTRIVTGANFQFNSAPGVQIGATQFTLQVQQAFATWYASPASLAFGSQFTFTQHFQVQGTVNDITSVTVTLENQQGRSQAVTGNF
jgi:hypothetical protein